MKMTSKVFVLFVVVHILLAVNDCKAYRTFLDSWDTPTDPKDICYNENAEDLCEQSCRDFYWRFQGRCVDYGKLGIECNCNFEYFQRFVFGFYFDNTKKFKITIITNKMRLHVHCTCTQTNEQSDHFVHSFLLCFLSICFNRSVFCLLSLLFCTVSNQALFKIQFNSFIYRAWKSRKNDYILIKRIFIQKANRQLLYVV